MSAKTIEQVKHCVRQCRSYPPQNQPRIIHDLIQCCRLFPMLVPAMGTLSFKQLSNLRLVALQGFYSWPNAHLPPLPLRIWVMPYFPKGPPLIFVLRDFETNNPFPIGPNHPHVDHETGLVYIPYLSAWHKNSSTASAVHETLQALSSVHFSLPQLSLFPSSSLSTDLVSSIISPPSSKVDSFDAVGYQPSKAELVTSLSKRLSLSILNVRRVSHETMMSLQLKRKALIEVLEECKRQYIENSTRQRLSMLAKKHETLLLTKRELEACNTHRNRQNNSDMSIDEATEAQQAVQNQAISCVATDLASDDVLDQMDEALCNGIVSINDYVAAMRRVAREQFFARALALQLKQVPSCTRLLTPSWPNHTPV